MDTAAVNPKGIKTLLANGLITFFINPNKDGLFKGSFSSGGSLTQPPFPLHSSYSNKNLFNININLYNCQIIYLNYVESKKNADIICFKLKLVSL